MLEPKTHHLTGRNHQFVLTVAEVLGDSCTINTVETYMVPSGGMEYIEELKWGYHPRSELLVYALLSELVCVLKKHPHTPNIRTGIYLTGNDHSFNRMCTLLDVQLVRLDLTISWANGVNQIRCFRDSITGTWVLQIVGTDPRGLGYHCVNTIEWIVANIDAVMNDEAWAEIRDELISAGINL